MANEKIPLSKKLNLKYFGDKSIMVFEKYDGVPIRTDLHVGACGKVTATMTTRSGKGTTTSVGHLADAAVHHMGHMAPCSIVGEVLHPTVHAFKDVSGMVRKDKLNTDLYMQVFDFHEQKVPNAEYRDRIRDAWAGMVDAPGLRTAPWVTCTPDEYEHVKGEIYAASETPDEYFEGWIVRDPFDTMFRPGERCNSFQKDVIEPTVDLSIIGYEEAIDKNGNPKGMVGRVIADYKGETIGVGPGKLTHAERAELWENAWVSDTGVRYAGKPGTRRIAEIKYKRDPSYKALRQPTFQCWRPEKTEPSYE